MAVLGLHGCSWAFSSCSNWRLFSNCSAWTSHWGGFSCCRAQALGYEFSRCCPVACQSSQTRDQTCVPYFGRQSLNQWSPRVALGIFNKLCKLCCLAFSVRLYKFVWWVSHHFLALHLIEEIFCFSNIDKTYFYR